MIFLFVRSNKYFQSSVTIPKSKHEFVAYYKRGGQIKFIKFLTVFEEPR